jgi:hypothetical protein
MIRLQITVLLLAFFSFVRPTTINAYVYDIVVVDTLPEPGIDTTQYGVTLSPDSLGNELIVDEVIVGDSTLDDSKLPFLKRRDPLRLGDFFGKYDYISIFSFALLVLNYVFSSIASVILGTLAVSATLSALSIILLIISVLLFFLCIFLAIWGLKRTRWFKLKGRFFAWLTILSPVISLVLGILLVVFFLFLALFL